MEQEIKLTIDTETLHQKRKRCEMQHLKGSD